MSRVRILYVTYDGILEPLGQSQVVSYLQRLAPEFRITVLSFEKPDDLRDVIRMARQRQSLETLGIEWVALEYHRRPPVLSTALDIVRGVRAARRHARTARPDIVHARSYVPSVIALTVARTTGAAFLFDMRGFWVDEKVEAGSWARGGPLFRIGKWWERRFLGRADAVVSLSREGVRHLPQLGLRPERDIPVAVIPTCVDVLRFTPGPKDGSRLAALGLEGATIVGSVGTLSNRYLRQDTLRCLAYLTQRIDGMKVLLVTKDDHAQLRCDAEQAGLDSSRLVLASADFSEMPAMVRLLDVGVFFMKPVFAQKASAATKMAELLACGVPVVVNDGVADSSALVRDERVGVVLPDTSAGSFEHALPAVTALLTDTAIRGRCRDVATRIFDADGGAARYAELYRALAVRRAGPCKSDTLA